MTIKYLELSSSVQCKAAISTAMLMAVVLYFLKKDSTGRRTATRNLSG